MNIFDLFLTTSFITKLIILILMVFSITSWAIFIHKTRMLNIFFYELKTFEDKFWSGVELFHLYQKSQERYNDLVGSELIFYNGFKEFIRLYKTNSHAPKVIVEGASRAMYISMNREIEIVENYIQFLGTIGSISPYIGLFGTVLGVIRSFIVLGSLKQVTLQTISPGIAEALIATAIGLFSAIPAVIAYNYLNQRISKLELNYNNFMEEFTAILYRQLFVST